MIIEASGGIIQPKPATLSFLFTAATLLRRNTEGAVAPVFGAPDLLQRFKRQGFVMALTTAAPVADTVEDLKTTRLLDYFEDRVHPRPGTVEPEFFTNIINVLGFSRASTLALESDVASVRAARRAGVVVSGFADPALGRRAERIRDALTEAGAAPVVENLLDLDTVLHARRLVAQRRAAAPVYR